MSNSPLLTLECDDLVRNLALTTFEDEKFKALDYFLHQVKFAEENVPFNDEALEDLELSFLEHCDEVLLKVARKELATEEWDDLHDEEYRTALLTRLEEVPILKGEAGLAPLPLIIEESCMLIEEMEDVGERWLLVTLLSKERLKALFDLLMIFKDQLKDEATVSLIREVLEDWMEMSPLLRGLDRDLYQQCLQELNGAEIVYFLGRFLQVNKEYSEFLQDQYLRQNPELLKRLATRLRTEATKQAKAGRL
ncbi:hypothetical protein HN748_03055 [Candidatus Peregrinibacteria bacterium]|nr:hypothetical protein [Candidatus Peregrinibacteria bacterium]MBT7483797.1 hypothetical protein [Candidatus Peregrinibacteria bacterium]MBT7703186.1 hypothetical protein [Candidatus Peregrinibacteria bacterium]